MSCSHDSTPNPIHTPPPPPFSPQNPCCMIIHLMNACLTYLMNRVTSRFLALPTLFNFNPINALIFSHAHNYVASLTITPNRRVIDVLIWLPKKKKDLDLPPCLILGTQSVTCIISFRQLCLPYYTCWSPIPTHVIFWEHKMSHKSVHFPRQVSQKAMTHIWGWDCWVYMCE